jgi:hypothetical protein
MRRFVLAVLLTTLATGACNSDRPREPASRTPGTAPTSAPARDDSSFRFPGAERVVAIGDVHGDVAATRRALRLAGALDEKDDWVGGKLVVVQTGDLLDRGDDEPDILDLLDRAAEQAKKAGGALHVLNGNHEVMNVAADFRYVTADGFRDYEGTALQGARGKQASLLPTEQRGRAAAFLPGGPVAKRLAARPIAIVVGDSVFAHGGVLPGHVRYGIGRINAETRSWMSGETQRAPEILNGDTAPIWTREYSDGEPSPRACSALEKALTDLSAKRMVVGHTVQKNGKVWRIDVGLAKHYGGRPAVLEIRGAEVRSLSADTPAAPAASGSPPAASSAPQAPAPRARGLSAPAAPAR